MSTTSTTLVGVKTIQGNDLSEAEAPRINTNISFSVSTTNPPTCQSIVSAALTAGSSNAFLSQWKLVDSGTGTSTDLSQVGNDMKKNLNNLYTGLSSSGVDTRTSLSMENDSNRQINTYLTKLESEQIPVLRLVDSCLKESIQPDYNELNKQKEATDESKLRLESVKDPETKVSYYEGWFPLFRPMSEAAIFGIFITAVFLLLLSIGIFLRMSGISFNISLPTLFVDSGATDTKKYMYIGLVLGAAGGLGIYGYEKGWFGSK
jgi:hypothetical protein